MTIISRQKFRKITNFCVIDKFSIQQHFKSSTQHCYPCAINYDYIVKAETSNQDAEIIYEKSLIGTVPEARVPPRYKSSLKKPEMLYKNVSKKLVGKIYDLFEDDFELFGYRPDKRKKTSPLSTSNRRIFRSG